MINLFRKNNSVGGYVPPTLVNLSLLGNKAKKFLIRRSNTLIPNNRNELVIPYYNSSNKYNEEVLVRIAIQKMKLFRDMKFRTKYKEILHIAQWLYAKRVSDNISYKRADVIAKAMGYKTRWEYGRYLDNKPNDYDKNELKFLSMTCNVSDFDRTTTMNIYQDMINGVLANKDIDELYREFVKRTAFADMKYIEQDDLTDYIKMKLQVRYPIGSNVPEPIVRRDANKVYELVIAFNEAVGEAKRYSNRMDMTGGAYYDDEEIYGEGTEYERKGVWKYKKITQAQVRYRVNKLIRMLSKLVNNPDNWYSYRVNRMVNESNTIMLDGEQYLEELAKAEADANEYDETMLTLPEGISDDLANSIMENANRDYERHMVDYWTNPNGVHGKAVIKSFTPTNTIHKAVREIAKRNSDRGVVPKNMYRMTTDKKVFTNKSTVAGGSMMIDCSGSMGFTEQDIREIIDDLPAANIAGYVGYNTKIDGYDGMIKIIAKDGRCDFDAIDKLQYYGANSVDLDGLKWLAEQPEPRIWISDQQVIGVDKDTGTYSNLNQAKRTEISRFMKRHNIIPIRVIADVKKLAKQLSK